MNNPYPFNLLSIATNLWKYRKFIFVITLAAGLAGLAGAIFRPKKYEAKAEFFLKNPFYADRNFLYNSDAKFIDYFASEEDMKRLSSLLQSDTLQNRIITKMHLAAAYGIDTNDDKEVRLFKKDFGTMLNLWRTDNKSIEVGYKDKNAMRAAAVTNMAVSFLEEGLQHFYSDTRNNMYQSVLRKINEEGIIIEKFTDSLVQLREQYGIYDILSPSRYNIMLSSMKDNGKPDFARGIEQIQNIESIKDEMVTVRARNLSLAEQYATGTAINELPLIYNVKSAVPPVSPEGPAAWAIVLTAIVAGLAFSCLLVLIRGAYTPATDKRAK